MKFRDFKVKFLLSIAAIAAVFFVAIAFAAPAKAAEGVGDKTRDLVESDRQKDQQKNIEQKNPDLAKVLKYLAQIRK